MTFRLEPTMKLRRQRRQIIFGVGALDGKGPAYMGHVIVLQQWWRSPSGKTGEEGEWRDVPLVDDNGNELPQEVALGGYEV